MQQAQQASSAASSQSSLNARVCGWPSETNRLFADRNTPPAVRVLRRALPLPSALPPARAPSSAAAAAALSLRRHQLRPAACVKHDAPTVSQTMHMAELREVAALLICSHASKLRSVHCMSMHRNRVWPGLYLRSDSASERAAARSACAVLNCRCACAVAAAAFSLLPLRAAATSCSCRRQAHQRSSAQQMLVLHTRSQTADSGSQP